MSDQQFRRDLICAALAGRSANYMRANGKSAALEAAVVIELADAALAAAGEPKPASTPCDDCMAERDSLRAEIARLHRLHEPLTEEEKCLVAKEAHGHLVVRDLVALDFTNPNFSVRLFVAMLERSITAVKNRRA